MKAPDKNAAFNSTPSSSFKVLLKTKTAQLAASHVHCELQKQLTCTPHIEPNLVTSALMSKWNWDAVSSPSNFSVFFTSWINPDPSTCNPADKKVPHRLLVKAFNGADCDSETLTCMTSGTICCPLTMKDAKRQLKVSHLFFEIIFGTAATVVAFVKKWETFMEQKEDKLEAHLSTDPLLGVRVICHVDHTIQLFIKSCRLATDPSQVNFSLLGVKEDHRHLSFHRFVQDLPSSVAKQVPTPSSPSTDDDRNSKHQKF